MKAEIPEVPFNAPDLPQLGLEVLDIAEARRRASEASLRPVHRLAFHTLTLIRSGRGEHIVDFTAHPCRAGTLLWTRPGQVQQFRRPGSLGGPHIMFVPSFPIPAPAAERLTSGLFGPTTWQLDDNDQYRAIETLFDQIKAEYDRPYGAANGEILRHLLAALILHIDRLSSGDRPGQQGNDSNLYRRFRMELERRYALSRRAEDYAARLGCSPKTLTRASLATTGHSAKYVIDARVVLEAQRLLAHTDTPISAVARQLGFSEQTNFGKFFLQHTGATPASFRQSHRL